MGLKPKTYRDTQDKIRSLANEMSVLVDGPTIVQFCPACKSRTRVKVGKSSKKFDWGAFHVFHATKSPVATGVMPLFMVWGNTRNVYIRFCHIAVGMVLHPYNEVASIHKTKYDLKFEIKKGEILSDHGELKYFTSAVSEGLKRVRLWA